MFQVYSLNLIKIRKSGFKFQDLEVALFLIVNEGSCKHPL